MNYYLIAGEASGDLHGSNLIKGLRAEDPNAQFHCWGGDLMQSAGATVEKHYRELAFMGFLEVIKNLPTILRNFKKVKADILRFRPDVLILIDYPGFNLRLVKWANENGIRVFYYISPQLWAWKASRVESIKKWVERMYVILPFEVDWYEKKGVEVDFEGHPLLDVVAQPASGLPPDSDLQDFKNLGGLDDSLPIIALLPGSRRQEISRMLEMMLSVVPHFPDYQFVIAGAPSIEREFYGPFLQKNKRVKLVENRTYDLLRVAKSALVTSGTATLETALFGVPQVVCYRSSSVSFVLAKWLVGDRIKYIAMPNLIAGEEVVKELIQAELTTGNLRSELEKTLDGESRKLIMHEYEKIKTKLGQTGASRRTAKKMVERLRGKD